MENEQNPLKKYERNERVNRCEFRINAGIDIIRAYEIALAREFLTYKRTYEIGDRTYLEFVNKDGETLKYIYNEDFGITFEKLLTRVYNKGIKDGKEILKQSFKELLK